MKGRALRRALQTSTPERLVIPLPQITDTTELITAERAHELLTKNKHNRPINWKKVEEFADIMARGEWQLHAQGIILDPEGNVLTGQTRLWAVIYSGSSVYMRVSRGTPRSAESVIDRGRPQSARDLAARQTERKHSPIEASIARAVLALRGIVRPSVDLLASIIKQYEKRLSEILAATKGTKKSKDVIMVLAGILECTADNTIALDCERIAGQLRKSLAPQTPESCWGRGAAFSLAMRAVSNLLVDSLIENSIN